MRRLTSPVPIGLLLIASVALAADTPPPTPASAGVSELIESLGIRVAPTPVRDRPGWKPLQRIMFRGDLPDLAEFLRPVLGGAELVIVKTPEDALAAAPTADAFFGMCTPELVTAGTQVRWIQSFYAGVERCVAIPAVSERNILLTNMQRVAGPVMAEHGIALLLALSRNLEGYVARQQTGNWDPETGDGTALRSLRGKTLLVVGLGGIGTEVARLANALGMRVIATRASDRPAPPYVAYVGKPAELLALAGQADAVIGAVPLTPETTGVFDARFFAAMRPGAYFINLGRGQSVVTDDLVFALKSGRLAGAGLDVTDPEPLPPDSPLWRAPNIIITPHMSAVSDDDELPRRLLLRENLRRYQAGEPMLSVVDVGRGY
jgi:phosphoglycerate dehydrogenase-like enzyme